MNRDRVDLLRRLLDAGDAGVRMKDYPFSAIAGIIKPDGHAEEFINGAGLPRLRITQAGRDALVRRDIGRVLTSSRP